MRLNYFRFAKNFTLNNFSFHHIYKPLNAQIELTLRCNARCVFCSIWKREYQQELEQEMTTEEVKHIIDELQQLGIQVVNFTGGEPTIRRDLPELITHVKKRGMTPTIATNGLTLYELIQSGQLRDVELIMVSLDWPNAENHDRYRGIKLFDKAIRGIRAAILARKAIIVSMVVTKENIVHMESMCQFTHKLGAMIEMLPCEDIIREENSAHTVATINEYIPDVHDYAEKIRYLGKIYPNLITDPFTAQIIEAGGFGNQNLLHCVSAKAFIVIHYTGEIVFPCKIHPVLKIDVRNRSIHEIYHSYEVKRIIDMQDSFPFCKGCRLGCAIATSVPTRWATLYQKYIRAFFNGNLF